MVAQGPHMQVQAMMQLCGHVCQVGRQKNHLVVSCFLPKACFLRTAPFVDSQTAHKAQHNFAFGDSPWVSAERGYYPMPSPVAHCKQSAIFLIVCLFLLGCNGGHGAPN